MKYVSKYRNALPPEFYERTGINPYDVTLHQPKPSEEQLRLNQIRENELSAGIVPSKESKMKLIVVGVFALVAVLIVTKKIKL